MTPAWRGAGNAPPSGVEVMTRKRIEHALATRGALIRHPFHARRGKGSAGNLFRMWIRPPKRQHRRCCPASRLFAP